MTGTWSEEQIGGHPADVYVPPGERPSHFALLFLHPVGLETLRGRDAFTRVFDELSLPCVCPLTKWSWWTDRIYGEFDPQLSAEAHVLKNVVPWMEQRWQLGPQRIGLFGISMGGQGALRMGFKHASRFPAVAGIASAIDYYQYHGAGLSIDEMYDSKEQCRQDTVPMHVHPAHYPPHIFFCIDPLDSEWFRGNDRLHEKLNALGVTHECDLTTSAGGHSWEFFEHLAERTIRFLYQGLLEQSRRLL